MSRRKPTRRRYSDEERAEALAALAANGGDLAATARQLGLPRKTLEGWARGRTPAPAADLRHEKKASLADRLDELAHALVGDLLTDRVASYKDKALSMGIAIDKARLLRGQPTAITDHTHRPDLSRLTDAELEALEALAARVNPQPGATGPPAGPGGGAG